MKGHRTGGRELEAGGEGLRPGEKACDRREKRLPTVGEGLRPGEKACDRGERAPPAAEDTLRESDPGLPIVHVEVTLFQGAIT